MKCRNKEVQALLPALLERSLDRESRSGVERHIAECEDCKTELALLRMMSGEPVPDPGEAFWAAMPGRVYREVQERKQDRSSEILDIVAGFINPRWAWVTAAIGIVAVASWILVRPATVDLARSLPENGTSVEDMASADPVDVAELSSIEFDAATQWAQNAFAPIREAVGEETAGSTERDINEYLSDLSPRELDRVFEMIKKKEQDTRQRLHINSGDEKDLV